MIARKINGMKINFHSDEFTDSDKAKVGKYIVDMMAEDSSQAVNKELGDGYVSLSRSYDYDNEQYVFAVKRHDKQWENME